MSQGPSLYDRLPRFHRRKDSQTGETLEALLDVVEDQADALHEDVGGLLDDFFVETCADWVVPYIGDLVGTQPLPDQQARRADVANTVRARRRKGTLPMLEDLAHDVTGWRSHAVAYREHVAWTQNLDHQRVTPAPASGRGDPRSVRAPGTVNLRDVHALDHLGGPFDPLTHTVDVRPIRRGAIRHNVPNAGLFVWPVRAYPFRGVPPRPVDPPDEHRFHFRPTGVDAPLYNNPDREPAAHRLNTEVHVPSPIRPRAFLEDPELYYGHGDEHAVAVYEGREPSEQALVDRETVQLMDLTDWPEPSPGCVGIDVRRGRLAFHPDHVPESPVTVTFHAGRLRDLGGGQYDRRASLVDATGRWTIEVEKGTEVATLQDALTAWRDEGRPDAAIRVADDANYGGTEMAPDGSGRRPITIDVPEGGRVALEAANRHRPSLRPVGNLVARAEGDDAELSLDGLVVEGSLEVRGPLGLRVAHCTIVPGRMPDPGGRPAFPDRDAVLVPDTAVGSSVRVADSVTGPLRVPETARGLTVTGSIVQAPDVDGGERPAIAADDDGAPSGDLWIERSTVLGGVRANAIRRADDVVFDGRVEVERRQVGCLRFSYVPPDSTTPRRYRCQPDLAIRRAREQLGPDATDEQREQARERVLRTVFPTFASRDVGHPEFGRLHPSTPDALRRGGEQGREMGAYHAVSQALRTDGLRTRLEEYLPFGLQAGIIDATSTETIP